MILMNVLLINPPLYFPNSIYGAIPILLGQLKGNNIQADALDLNYEFFYDILSPEHLKKTLNELKKIYFFNKYFSNIKILRYNDKYCLSQEQIKKQNQLIKSFIFNKQESIIKIINSAQKIFKILPEDCNENNLKLFYIALSFTLLPYYPSVLKIPTDQNVHFYEINPLYKYTYEDIINRCSNSKRNIFVNYFRNKIKKVNADKYDVIGITIPFNECLYPALTLGKILKDKTNAKVIMGGIDVNIIQDSFKKHPEMFGKYFDALMTGEGEKSIVDYIRYRENKFPIEKISGLIYKKDNKIIQNKIEFINDIDTIKPPCYDNIKFENYFAQSIQIEFSKGCYWGKCSFCYNSFQKRYYIKNPIKAVDIIESLLHKYNYNVFSIFDDALNPNFAEKFADEIIKRQLKIKYACFFRFENSLTYEKLKKLKESGLYGIFFGCESASERILKLMNKNIDLTVVERILKDTYKLGIISDVAFITNFPTETKDDLMQTIDFIKRNEKYMPNAKFSTFYLLKNSPVLNFKEKLGITNIKTDEEFSNTFSFTAPGISAEEASEILKKYNLK